MIEHGELLVGRAVEVIIGVLEPTRRSPGWRKPWRYVTSRAIPVRYDFPTVPASASRAGSTLEKYSVNVHAAASAFRAGTLECQVVTGHRGGQRDRVNLNVKSRIFDSREPPVDYNLYWKRDLSMRKIGIHDIARLARVSIGTVDRALHGRKRISEKTRTRVLRIAKELAYRPNLAARALSVARPAIRIGVCIPRELHFFYDQVLHGLLAEARRYEHLGVDLIYRPVDRLGLGESEKVKELLASEIEALVVTPANPEQLSPLINEAEKKGVRVICVATDAPASSRSTVVCVEPELNGRMAGELMGRFVPPHSQVAIVTGMLSTEDHRKKVQGFSEVFPQVCTGAQVVEVLEGHEDEDETFLKCLELLGKLKCLAGLYVNTANCLPVCRALSALGLAGKIKLIATDVFKEMVPYFEKGTIVASIYQRPYVQGQSAVRLVIDHLVSGRPIPPTYYLNPGVVIRSNLHLFREILHPEATDLHSPPSATLGAF